MGLHCTCQNRFLVKCGLYHEKKWRKKNIKVVTKKRFVRQTTYHHVFFLWWLDLHQMRYSSHFFSIWKRFALSHNTSVKSTEDLIEQRRLSNFKLLNLKHVKSILTTSRRIRLTRVWGLNEGRSQDYLCARFSCVIRRVAEKPLLCKESKVYTS